MHNQRNERRNANPFRLQIGSYWITLPGDAVVSAEVKGPGSRPNSRQMVSTDWTITLGRFRLAAHLNPLQDLSGLKSFIDHTTKSFVVTPPVTVNGIAGVTYGTYGTPRNRIHWWFKKGDVMICLNLRSRYFPANRLAQLTIPTQDEIDLLNVIIGSLRYCRDFPGERPPVRQEEYTRD